MEIVRKTIDKDLEYLRQVSEPVDFAKDDVRGIVNSLKQLASIQVFYALAPIQIGIPKRLIYIRNSSDKISKYDDLSYDEGTVMINPKIISKKGKSRFLEGCVSCLNYAAVVERPYEIVVTYYDLNGVEHTETISGLPATIISHEYDHLDGIFHLDRSKEIYQMTIEDKKQYRQVHPYEVISEDCDFEYPEIDWFKM